jgi:hypothetical protein
MFKTKIPVWVNFGGPCNGRCWYILWTFGIFFSILACCTKKYLATLLRATYLRLSNFFRNRPLQSVILGFRFLQFVLISAHLSQLYLMESVTFVLSLKINSREDLIKTRIKLCITKTGESCQSNKINYFYNLLCYTATL